MTAGTVKVLFSWILDIIYINIRLSFLYHISHLLPRSFLPFNYALFVRIIRFSYTLAFPPKLNLVPWIPTIVIIYCDDIFGLLVFAHTLSQY